MTAVVPAHARPVELRQAIDAIVDQDYDGDLDVIVVFDRAEPDLSLEREEPRRVRVMPNGRTPGLAGARNTGIMSSSAELVAFCDDDDYWNPEKLRKQVEALLNNKEAEVVACAMVVESGERSTDRLAGTSLVTFDQLLRSRMAMVHSSSLVFVRTALLEGIGLVDEDIPGSQNEDWDILIRAARRHPIINVDEALVHVRWNAKSHFRRDWQTKIDSAVWMLDHHPELRANSRGAARVMGKIAFAYASAGERAKALRWAGRAWRLDPRQWRSYLAVAVCPYPPAGGRLLGYLNGIGRGV